MMTGSAMIGPILALALMIGGWLVAGSRNQHQQPRRALVGLGQWMAMTGFLLALLSIPPAVGARRYAVALVLLLVAGIVLVRRAGRNAVGWTSTGEIVTSAVILCWRTPRRVLWSLGALLLGIGVAVWLAQGSWPLSGLLGGLVILAPARWWIRAGYEREKARTGVEKALAGVITGGEEWDGHTASMRGAPIKVKFRGDVTPAKIVGPLPPGWRETSMERDRAEIRGRLTHWGSPWTIVTDSSGRAVCATLCEPLPTAVRLPQTRSWKWIDANKPSPLALYLGEAQDADLGETFPLWWDPDATDPHALIGGKTKSGKTVGLRLLVAQAIVRGWDVIIADPKGVDFVWAGRLPGVRYFPGKDCINGVVEAVAEMHARQDWLSRQLWSGKDGADEEGDLLKVQGQPYAPCLVIVDEAAELSGLGDGDQQKETQANLSSLARLSRFAGMVCAFATQRPDVKFLSGETKANLGTRVMYGSGGPTLTNMVLEMSLKELSKLTDTCRGRGRAVVTEGTAVEFQGGFISPSNVKALRGVLEPDGLTPVRYVEEPEWRSLLRAGTSTEEMSVDALKHPDYDRVAAEIDQRIEASEARFWSPVAGQAAAETHPQEGATPTLPSWDTPPTLDTPISQAEEPTSPSPIPADDVPPDTPSIDPMKYL
ncbi:FtsK/SpoIIIE domain-containing protein [Brevibacterium casei]|uniref:FtsK/SpoIIIE domain-containing protein n=2 Tax=Brevibacterium casei TaxID=33889 RepID=UPI00223B8499|nr:FtsK/SpoIIIE domain-containing protein [Brevibacterium casei]MCT1561367.1 hypothetical protein [Brevibacterium casei]MCT2209543.1 hypothetical protein [Brevibacterium casei]